MYWTTVYWRVSVFWLNQLWAGVVGPNYERVPDNTIKRSQSDSCVFCLIKKLPEKDYRGRVGEELLYKFPHYAALPQSQRCGSGEMTNTMASKWELQCFLWHENCLCFLIFQLEKSNDTRAVKGTRRTAAIINILYFSFRWTKLRSQYLNRNCLPSD